MRSWNIYSSSDTRSVSTLYVGISIPLSMHTHTHKLMEGSEKQSHNSTRAGPIDIFNAYIYRSISHASSYCINYHYVSIPFLRSSSTRNSGPAFHSSSTCQTLHYSRSYTLERRGREHLKLSLPERSVGPPAILSQDGQCKVFFAPQSGPVMLLFVSNSTDSTDRSRRRWRHSNCAAPDATATTTTTGYWAGGEIQLILHAFVAIPSRPLLCF